MNKHSAVFFDKNPLVLCLVDNRPGMGGRRETIIHNVKPCGKPLRVSTVNGRFVPYAVIRGRRRETAPEKPFPRKGPGTDCRGISTMEGNI